ncbi:hypothetical protein [Nakamurella sp.]|uniref:hypothetical protein n=1 Tax=Nakamurella sp. TaxID=1869182 RepID=UPI00378419E6
MTALILGFRFSLALVAFAVAEVWSERVWPAVGGMPVWVVVVTMAVVGALFGGTGGALSRLAERIVLRDRADGYQAGRTLLRRMSTALPIEDVLPSLAEITGRTLQVDRSEVRVRLDGGRTLSQVWPDRAGPQGAPVVVQVRHDGDTVGEIEADVARPAGTNRENALLRQLAGPAGLAMSTVRLTVELQRRAAALQRLTDEIAASNERIGRVRQHESDTITAEIRGRVDPRLDAADRLIGRALQAPAGDPAGPELIGRARDLVGQGLDELRDLARRIYPPRLGEGGLAAALEGWQLRTGVGLDLAVADDPRLRSDPTLESCLYFLIVAALPHRAIDGARPIVSVEVRSDRVTVDVVTPARAEDTDRAGDDGGLATAATLAAINDRVDAFGGTLTVTETGGRRIARAWLPLDGEGAAA